MSGFQFLAVAGSYLGHHLQTDFWAHSASLPVDIGGIFPGSKAFRAWN